MFNFGELVAVIFFYTKSASVRTAVNYPNSVWSNDYLNHVFGFINKGIIKFSYESWPFGRMQIQFILPFRSLKLLYTHYLLFKTFSKYCLGDTLECFT